MLNLTFKYNATTNNKNKKRYIKNKFYKKTTKCQFHSKVKMNKK